MLFARKAPPTRSEVIVKADLARSKGKLKKAVAGYRKALELESRDSAVHLKLAPLLARTNEPEAALQSFRAAAQGYLDKGFEDKALAAYTQAAETLQSQVSLWRQVAQMNLARGRRADAVRLLLRGRLYLRHKAERADAIALLKEALTLEPTLFEPRLDLARLLASLGRTVEAMALLEPMVKEVKGGQLQQVCWARWRVSPSLGTGWRWLRAALAGR